MTKIKELYLKHKEIILYIFFGAVTTLVDLLVFWLFDFIFDGGLYLLSTLIAWAVATLFAYFVNKLFVFESRSFNASTVLREALEFFGARVFSLAVSELGMVLFVDVMGFERIAFTFIGVLITGNLIAKAILSVIVIILNYFFSKFIIFKKKKPENKEENK